jgi:hypothetical protein
LEFDVGQRLAFTLLPPCRNIRNIVDIIGLFGLRIRNKIRNIRSASRNIGMAGIWLLCCARLCECLC